MSRQARDIVTIWYDTSVCGTLGTPDDNQYIRGLVWVAGQAHPVGYADDNTPSYWRFAVEGNRNTGLSPYEGGAS